MKPNRIFLLLAVLVFTAAALGQRTTSVAAASAPQAQQSPQSPPTIASTLDREISTIEKEIVEAAEAMPEDKFNFSPENLSIPGSGYVHNAEHVAARAEQQIAPPVSGHIRRRPRL
ncbi:MAG TPA: hypothetical protein VN943_15350 [Candidatus Acidoferrum sp.]|nr:hypothetical protein [Candidatus Acidoferrum sp.]